MSDTYYKGNYGKCSNQHHTTLALVEDQLFI